MDAENGDVRTFRTQTGTEMQLSRSCLGCRARVSNRVLEGNKVYCLHDVILLAGDTLFDHRLQMVNL
jgi:hypothetical protein